MWLGGERAGVEGTWVSEAPARFYCLWHKCPFSASPVCCPVPLSSHPSLSRGFLSAFVCSVMSFSFVSGLRFSVCIWPSSLGFQSSISFLGASEGPGPSTVYPKPSSWTHLRNLLSSLPVSEISPCGIETKFASSAPLTSSPSLHNPVTLCLGCPGRSHRLLVPVDPS